MAAGKAAAPGRSRSRAAAAVREANGKAPTIKWRKLDLVLPAEAPGDLAFSIENGEASAAVQEIFGDQQYVQIREKLKAEKLSMVGTFEALAKLLGLCFEAWGLAEGE